LDSGAAGMKVAVVGLWHLGAVTAACLASVGHRVIAYDPSSKIITHLQNGQPPLFEPGLEELLKAGLLTGQLTCTANISDLTEAEIVWVTFDTPVDNNDLADVDSVIQQVVSIFSSLQDDTLVIISSQVPVGTTQKIQAQCSAFYPTKNISFAVIPENLRLGKAITVFTQPDRIVIGLDNYQYKSQLEELLQPFSTNLVWMSTVSAEMTKHAINAFLALSVTFINELSALCETVGANGRDVEKGLKSEERIGEKAYLRPGGAIAGGTLLRDINYLKQLGERQQLDTFLISAIADSNDYHKQWSCRKLLDLLKDLNGKKVAMLGLTYKVGTDTLRRSTAIETCEWLHQQGVAITAYDPVINALPDDVAQFIDIKSTLKDALHLVDAVVISTEWPEFRDLTPAEFSHCLKQPFILDASGFVAKNLANDARLHYFSVGVPA
jgi:UDPglucose 6-dehydrogenase